MRLEIDMGNTRIKWRLMSGSAVLDRGYQETGGNFSNLESILDAYRCAVSAIWVASVVGDEIEKKLSTWAEKFFSIEPIFARACESFGIVRNGYEQPEQLGVDRWLGLLAGYRLVGGSCLIISCGTAVTVDLLSSDGVHKGGYIAPGFGLMLSSINSAARLIHVDKERFSMGLLPGRSTNNAVCAGISAMLFGVVENGIRQLQGRGGESVELVLTGGDANRLLSFYPCARLVPDLVLDGLVCALGHQALME